MYGRLVIFGMMAYAGDDASAERALAPFRQIATPIADLVKPMPYVGMYPPEDPNYRPRAVSRTMFLDALDQRRAETVFDWLSASDAGMRAAQLRVLGGAAARVRADATAYAHRSKAMLVNVAAFYQADAEREARRAWVSNWLLEPENPWTKMTGRPLA